MAVFPGAVSDDVSAMPSAVTRAIFVSVIPASIPTTPAGSRSVAVDSNSL